MSEHLEKYMDDANLDDLGADASTENVDTGGQADEQPDEAVEASAETSESPSLEDQLESVEAGAESDLGGVLNQLNDLGLLRHGMPIQLESIDQVKELLSKGHDYTAKTQEHAEAVKQWETEREQQNQAFEEERKQFDEYRTEVQESLTENQIFTQVIEDIKVSDPELFNELANAYRQKMSMFNAHNPALDKVNKELNDLKQSIAGSTQQKQTEQNQQILQTWENELGAVQTAYAAKMRTLGIKPDWQAVQKNWAADTSNETSVKQAFFAVHGEQIQKALDAAAKTATIKKQSAVRKGPDAIDQGQASAPVKRTHGSGSYMADLEKLAEKHAG